MPLSSEVKTGPTARKTVGLKERLVLMKMSVMIFRVILSNVDTFNQMDRRQPIRVIKKLVEITTKLV